MLDPNTGNGDCTIFPESLHTGVTCFGHLRTMLSWRRLVLLGWSFFVATATMSIDCTSASAQSRSVLRAEDIAHQRPANFFKLRYARSASVCREYGRSIAGPATRYPFPFTPWPISYSAAAGDAVSRSTLEIPALEIDPDDFAKDVPIWFRKRGLLPLPMFFHVDFDNTGRVSLAMIWNIPVEGRSLVLPTASLRDRAYQPDDPAVLSAIQILPYYPQRQAGLFEAWHESEALIRSIEAAISRKLPGFAGPMPAINRYYWFARVAGRTYLSNTLWVGTERSTDVYALLIELRPDGEGVLICGFSNASPIGACPRDLPRGFPCFR